MSLAYSPLPWRKLHHEWLHFFTFRFRDFSSFEGRFIDPLNQFLANPSRLNRSALLASYIGAGGFELGNTALAHGSQCSFAGSSVFAHIKSSTLTTLPSFASASRIIDR